MAQNPCIVGFDFGTTSLSAVVISLKKKKIEKELCYTTNAYLPFEEAWRKEQSLDKLSALFFKILDEINAIKDINIVSYGFTGQMHGIIGLNQQGKAVTNLVTWQDKSGNMLLPEGISLLEKVQTSTSDALANGYGIITLYKWLHCDKRTDITGFCTVADYFASMLAETKPDYMNESNAHSIGLFNIQTSEWDQEAIRKLQMETIHFPRISSDSQIIGYANNIPVICAIGDNQASFLGSVTNPEEAILLNAGTGTQLSCLINKEDIKIYEKYIDGFETQLRPYNETSFLLATSFINGGSVYKSLFNFFKEVGTVLLGSAQMDENMLWKKMEACGQEVLNETNQLQISPLLDGQRKDLSRRGSIDNLSAYNFHPGYFISGFLTGLSEYYMTGFYPELRERTHYICASGNGLKRNTLFRNIIEKTFGCPLYTVAYNEEASVGAALNGAMGIHAIQKEDCGIFLSALSETSDKQPVHP